MARKKAIEERVKALVAEILAEEELEGLGSHHENIVSFRQACVTVVVVVW